MTSVSRVKLCAIARNEGPYLADWVHHHLYFGFDAVEVWVNGTEDPSISMLKRIAKRHPNVFVRKADRLLEECVNTGEHFQLVAYERMAQKARREGFTHASFLDLDEYWVPLDCAASVKTFVPEDPDVSVISFQWCTDVPRSAAATFSPPITRSMEVQPDPHVKSVIRLDDSVAKILTHTARLRRGRRLLVRDPFPMVDQKQQRGGSCVPLSMVQQEGSHLPEAFILHAINRSEPEYVARLAVGLRQTKKALRVKTNRRGYLPTDSPVNSFSPDGRAFRRYEGSRRRFHRRLGIAPLVTKSRAATLARGQELMAAMVTSPETMGELRYAMRGVHAPELDHAYSGWNSPTIHRHVDRIEEREGAMHVWGWAFTVPSVSLEFALMSPGEGEWLTLRATRGDRPDVQAVHADAPIDCGFDVEIPRALAARLTTVDLGIRAVGAAFWDRVSLVLPTP